MTKFPLEHAPFLPIHLIDSDKEALLDLANTFVTETIEDYERHLRYNNGIVDSTEWVRVKQFEDVVVYEDRRALKERRLSRVSSSCAPKRNGNMLKLLWAGTIRGDLDDVMYAAKSDGIVETYVKVFIDLMGDMPLRVATTLSTSGVVSVWKLGEYALMKKLNWRLSQRRSIVPSDWAKLCHVCSKIIQGSMIRRRTCKICMHQCCARCCVSKKMFFVPAHSRAAVQKIANVCTNCIQTASYSNGMDIALGEISRTAGQFKAYAYWAVASPTSSSSSLML
ncbi:hypothetical protein PI124_g4120 [Phytophthora idaei]|nr:hypothetical protein PI125_g2741 [Phytophthora idaei]KAG3251274.1 hypothetical protein PI124_g4120 [Phytophthora idaei]